MTDRCDKCHWWEKIYAGTERSRGKCRFHPPIILVTTAQRAITEWPQTYSDDWCGRFANKDNILNVTFDR